MVLFINHVACGEGQEIFYDETTHKGYVTSCIFLPQNRTCNLFHNGSSNLIEIYYQTEDYQRLKITIDHVKYGKTSARLSVDDLTLTERTHFKFKNATFGTFDKINA